MKHKQRKIFFLNTDIGNLDNLVDLEDEVNPTFDEMEAALDAARKNAKEHGLRTYVYRCTPIFQVDRGKVRITKLS